MASYSGSKYTEVLRYCKKARPVATAGYGKTLVVDDLYGAIYGSLPSAATFTIR